MCFKTRCADGSDMNNDMKHNFNVFSLSDRKHGAVIHCAEGT